ncbi:MAG: hypothetical protein LQ342_000594 [Letrouitia transgressa]|nr:MAG: hypothetical protein LQ342_000594 [Letrouitia transgressa]
MDVNVIEPPPCLNPNCTVYLAYNDEKPLPPPLVIPIFDFFNDMDLVPADHMPLLRPVDQRIFMATGWSNVDGIQSHPALRLQRGRPRPSQPHPDAWDTVMANDNAQLAVRFRADNPGMWLWHCPVEAGLPATMVEAPEQLSTPTIPDDHLEACRAYGMKTEADPLDLDGSATSVPGENHGVLQLEL